MRLSLTFLPRNGLRGELYVFFEATEWAGRSAASRHLAGNQWGGMKGWSSLFPSVFHQQPLPSHYLAQKPGVCIDRNVVVLRGHGWKLGELWDIQVFLGIRKV